MAASPEPKKNIKQEIDETCKEIEAALRNGARATVRRKLKKTAAELRVDSAGPVE